MPLLAPFYIILTPRSLISAHGVLGFWGFGVLGVLRGAGSASGCWECFGVLGVFWGAGSALGCWECFGCWVCSRVLGVL